MYLALAAAAIAAASVLAAAKLALRIHRILSSPLRALNAPPSPSWIYGNMNEIFNAENSELHEKWAKQYGSTYRYAGFFGDNRLFTLDTRALHHIMSHSTDYQKPAQVRINLAAILGPGVLVTEGEQHRQQRRIMNPAFGPAQIRALTDIFIAKAISLRDILAADMPTDAQKQVDVLDFLSRATLDIIGLAGFNYHFDALTPSTQPNELNQAFATIFTQTRRSLLPLLQAFLPFLKIISTQRQRQQAAAINTMNRIGYQLFRDSKAAILADNSKKSDHPRDLLSLLVHANMDTDVPESHRLADADVVAQVPTFLVAGHETTSTATTWTLFSLTQNPAIQSRLREELLAVDTDTPDMDSLMALPYLDAVVREALRIHSPVPGSVRIATKDDSIPLAAPIIDRYGVSHDTIRIAKGDSIIIPILAMNRDESIWGPDARVFRPERWLEEMPEAVSNVPGVWGHLMTFIGGPRACIGYRFSLVEMKALLFSLVRAFEFELAVPPEDIGKKTAIVQRPIVRSHPKQKSAMPILIRPARV